MYRTRTVGNHPKRVRIIETFEVVDENGKKEDVDVVREYEPDYLLRYGTNPHQPSAHYSNGLPKLSEIKTGKSGMSQTNVEDILHACEILKYFSDPACAIMKHLNPSGVAVRSTPKEALEYAWNCDYQAAFGGVAVFNKPVDMDVVNSTKGHYIEVICAPDFEEGVLDSLQDRGDLRVVQVSGIDKLPKYVGDEVQPNIKTLEGHLFLETPYLTKFRTVEDLLPHVVSERKPSELELRNMLNAWYVCSSVRSNGIVLWKDGYSLGIGTGQQDRITAVEQAIEKNRNLNWKAREKNRKRGSYILFGAAIASDGFFPFVDSIELCGKAGIQAIIQPGGSKRDEEVIEAANKYNMSMVFTGERCFSHH
ncbi:MAG: IMP cyclohydrolase [Candidatus Aenigmarchaeota archaeon]|nr:IMP cyclohydrolase [Candidatus Aenigmarchaeota archaeon]